MGEPELSFEFASEQALTRAAGAIATCWRRAGLKPLLVGLRGELGTGKTTWARGMLRGLGYEGRVPSPTYTLVEEYVLGGSEPLTVAHLDLYRLAAEDELEHLGVRDSLADPGAWLLVEWPERAPAMAAACDVTLCFDLSSGGGRRVAAAGATALGRRAIAAVADLHSSNVI